MVPLPERFACEMGAKLGLPAEAARRRLHRRPAGETGAGTDRPAVCLAPEAFLAFETGSLCIASAGVPAELLACLGE